MNAKLVKRTRDDYRTPVDANRAALFTQCPPPEPLTFFMSSPTAHHPESVHQSANVVGNGNTTYIANRDIIINPPAPQNPTPAPAQKDKPANQKQRTPRRWISPWRLGGGTGALATAIAAFQFALPSAALTRPIVWPEGKSALCRDGRYSPSQSRSGTCSGHKGVAHWRYDADDAFYHRVERLASN